MAFYGKRKTKTVRRSRAGGFTRRSGGVRRSSRRTGTTRRRAAAPAVMRLEIVQTTAPAIADPVAASMPAKVVKGPRKARA